MPNLNTVLLMGNLTRDVELKYTPKGTAVTQITIAVNHVYKVGDEKREEVTFVDVELWGRQAEIASQYCGKGKPLFVQGRLKLDVWEDKESGQKRSKMKVVGESIQLLGQRGEGSKESAEDRVSQKITESRHQRPAQTRKPPVDPDLDGMDQDDIPY